MPGSFPSCRPIVDLRVLSQGSATAPKECNCAQGVAMLVLVTVNGYEAAWWCARSLSIGVPGLPANSRLPRSAPAADRASWQSDRLARHSDVVFASILDIIRVWGGADGHRRRTRFSPSRATVDVQEATSRGTSMHTTTDRATIRQLGLLLPIFA